MIPWEGSALMSSTYQLQAYCMWTALSWCKGRPSSIEPSITSTNHIPPTVKNATQGYFTQEQQSAGRQKRDMLSYWSFISSGPVLPHEPRCAKVFARAVVKSWLFFIVTPCTSCESSDLQHQDWCYMSWPANWQFWELPSSFPHD
jgi:hypothetical protein